MPIDPDQISQTARDLIERHGAAAVRVAEERVQNATRAGDHPALDMALMVLSDVERQLIERSRRLSGTPR